RSFPTRRSSDLVALPLIDQGPNARRAGAGRRCLSNRGNLVRGRLVDLRRRLIGGIINAIDPCIAAARAAAMQGSIALIIPPIKRRRRSTSRPRTRLPRLDRQRRPAPARRALGP